MQLNNKEISDALHHIAYYIDKLGDCFDEKEIENHNKTLTTYNKFNIIDFENILYEERNRIHHIEVSNNLYSMLECKDTFTRSMMAEEIPGNFGFQVPRLIETFYGIPIVMNNNLENSEYRIIYEKEKED